MKTFYLHVYLVPTRLLIIRKKSHLHVYLVYTFIQYHGVYKIPNVFTITVTSRPMGEYEVDGQSCWFVEQERMPKGVEENEFLLYCAYMKELILPLPFPSVHAQ